MGTEIIFECISDKIFYKVLKALTLMKGKGIGKVKFEETYVDSWNSIWKGEVHFLSKEAMGVFARKFK